MSDLDADVIAFFVEKIRFPPPDDLAYKATDNWTGLFWVADFIGQPGDPVYFRKIFPLF